MQFPARGQQIVEAFYALHTDLAQGSDDDRRELTLMIAEQIRFELGAMWGTKSAGPGRPPSKDSIAFLTGDDRMLGWDWQNGVTREPWPAGEMTDITGQMFIAVAPVDRLGGTMPPPDPPPPGTGIPYDEAKSIQFGLACNDVYTESGAPFDPGMIGVHSARAAWDYYVGGLSWPASFEKHVNEFRAVYGLPPI
jgi:hypothetical protein